MKYALSWVPDIDKADGWVLFKFDTFEQLAQLFRNGIRVAAPGQFVLIDLTPP